MTKLEFLFELREKLKGLPKNEIDERLSFYSEMIEDRVEEGILEEEAVQQIGNIDEIAEQIISEIPLTKIAKERIKPKRKISTWETVLLIVGSPIWCSLLLAVICSAISIYISLWAILISLWSVFVSFVACALALLITGVMLLSTPKSVSGFAMIGASLILMGLSILMFFICKLATKGTVVLTKKIILGIKKCFIKKEEE